MKVRPGMSVLLGRTVCTVLRVRTLSTGRVLADIRFSTGAHAGCNSTVDADALEPIGLSRQAGA